MSQTKTTQLYSKHTDLAAKMVEFAGYKMPIQYKSIVNEHLTVRNHIGIFDVSHMGQILITAIKLFSLFK